MRGAAASVLNDVNDPTESGGAGTVQGRENFPVHGGKRSASKDRANGVAWWDQASETYRTRAMFRSTHALPILAFIGVLFGLTSACSGAPDAQAVGLEVDDFIYLDTSGEPTDQTAAHEARLRAFMTALRHDIEADGQYHLVPSSCAASCTFNGSMTSERLRAASKAGANLLIIGIIRKTSTLVQWARVRVIDVEAGRVAFERLYTFRGDNDEAWRRAEAFISQDIREKAANSPPSSGIAASEPTKLAIFAFELEDASAAAPANGATATDAADAAELAKTTDAVRQLFAQSPRYRLIEVGAANADAAKAHDLRNCDGCDAKIALSLGADQSLIGIVRRISRTEYTIRIQLRETRTGAVVGGADSGLRMGANYSWSRGAVRLISDKMLHTPQ